MTTWIATLLPLDRLLVPSNMEVVVVPAPSLGVLSHTGWLNAEASKNMKFMSVAALTSQSRC